MATKINYILGDATNPSGPGNRIIVHICNDIGGWGAGFVMAISRKWRDPEQYYREWYKSGKDFELGKVQFVHVEDEIWVANMIGQRHVSYDKQGNPPIRYKAVKQCLSQVTEKAKELNASVHMPRIGCGLAGGKWEEIEPLIMDTLIEEGVLTTVYDFG